MDVQQAIQLILQNATDNVKSLKFPNFPGPQIINSPNRFPLKVALVRRLEPIDKLAKWWWDDDDEVGSQYIYIHLI